MSKPKQPIYVVDAFAEQPFAGNPAAVCPLVGPATTAWMQRVAAEMNLSETAFVHAREGRWCLRWFTPTVEVDLCGHATMAAAHTLWETGRATPAEPLVFHTRSGALTVFSEGALCRMDFPALPVVPTPGPADLPEALGAVPMWVGTNGMDLFVELVDEGSVRCLRPDLGRLSRYPVRGVIVTARSASVDFVSRFFAPASGVPEDPVTGSAHGALGPYWAEKLGRTELVGLQVSARGGRVQVGVRGDRVLLGGSAVTILRGELDVPCDLQEAPWSLLAP
jgi:PhzF family phenazine biosynthesis protein